MLIKSTSLVLYSSFEKSYVCFIRGYSRKSYLQILNFTRKTIFTFFLQLQGKPRNIWISLSVIKRLQNFSIFKGYFIIQIWYHILKRRNISFNSKLLPVLIQNLQRFSLFPSHCTKRNISFIFSVFVLPQDETVCLDNSIWKLFFQF